MGVQGGDGIVVIEQQAAATIGWSSMKRTLHIGETGVANSHQERSSCIRSQHCCDPMSAAKQFGLL